MSFRKHNLCPRYLIFFLKSYECHECQVDQINHNIRTTPNYIINGQGEIVKDTKKHKNKG